MSDAKLKEQVQSQIQNPQSEVLMGRSFKHILDVSEDKIYIPELESIQKAQSDNANAIKALTTRIDTLDKTMHINVNEPHSVFVNREIKSETDKVPVLEIASIEPLQKALSEYADTLKAFGARIDALEKSLPNLGAITELATALNSSIEATKTSAAQQVKSMLDNRGWLNLAELYSARSATDNTVEDGKRAKGPEQTEPNAQAGGPVAGRFIKT
jgi:hypothetical protein